MTFRNIILVLSIFTVGFGVFAATGHYEQKDNSQEPKSDHKKLVEAIRRGGLREAAKIKRHYVTTAEAAWDWSRFDLESLTRTSSAVVIGSPVDSSVRLSASGETITTEYNFRIKDVLKGSVEGIVKVGLLGGKIEFEDGTSAEVQTPGFEKMTVGKAYILFLYANKNGSNVFLITGGDQGLFEITDSRLKSHAKSSDIVAKEARNKMLEDFLNQVRFFVSNAKADGCCQ